MLPLSQKHHYLGTMAHIYLYLHVFVNVFQYILYIFFSYPYALSLLVLPRSIAVPNLRPLHHKP